MSRTVQSVIGAAALTVTVLAGGVAIADDMTTAIEKLDPIELTFGIFVPPTSILGQTYSEYGKMLEERSQGKITLRYFWSGSLFSLPEALQSVGDGIADMGLMSAGYTPADMPVTSLLEHAYNASDIWVGQRATGRLHAQSEVLQEEFKRNRVKWVAPYASGTYQFFFGKGTQWNSVEDFKGRTLRTTGGTRSPWHSLLGAEPIFMSVNEIYEAADRGVIWGFENTLSLADDLKQGEVVGTLLKLDSGVVMGASTVMNLDKWNSFSPEIQKLIIDTGIEWAETVQAKALIEQEQSIVEDWTSKGIIIMTPDERSDLEFRRLALESADDAAAEVDKTLGSTAGSQTLADLRALVDEANLELKNNGHPW